MEPQPQGQVPMLACPSSTALERAFAALVDGQECPDVVAHVEGCNTCQHRLEALVAGGANPLLPGGGDSHPSAQDQTADRFPPSPPPDAAEPWPAVPGYQILGRLGHGGMGVVYQARHEQLNRVVALKMIRAGEHADPDKLARFHLEAEAVAHLRHPNIVAIHDIGMAGGVPYIALEYLPGGNLEQRLQRGAMPPAEVARMLAALAQAVHTAHLAGIVHRDLKPSNVLLAGDGTAKVTDFGLAKRLEQQGQTQTGQIIGTPAYMAPEQARGDSKNVGPAADVYALGALLYEALTGRPPFRGDTMMQTLQMVLTDDPVPPRKLAAGVPADLETVCLKALRKEPHERYPTAQEFADELNRFLHDEPVRARPLRGFEKTYRWCRRYPTLAGLVASSVVILLMAAVASLLGVYHVRLQGALAGEEEQRGRAEDALRQAKRFLYFNRIYLADRAYHDNQMARARQLLAAYYQSELAGWEWHYLDRITRAERLVAAGHSEAVHALAFAPHGRWLVSGGADRTLLFWKPHAERMFQRWAGHTEAVGAVAVSADGKRLASAAGSARKPGELIVWDTTGEPGAAGRELFRVGGTGEHAAVAFHPTEPLLALATGLVAGQPARVRLFDGGGREVACWDGPAGQGGVAAAWSRDGKDLALSFVRIGPAGGPGQVVIRDVQTGADRHRFAPHGGNVRALAYSPDGRTLATAGGDRLIHLWDTRDFTLRQTCRGHTSSVNALTFAPDGRLLSGGKDTTVRAWDPVTGEEQFVRRGHVGQVFCVANDPATKQIYSGSEDTLIRAWRSEQPQEAAVFALHQGEATALAFSPDGAALVSVGQDGAVWRIDPAGHDQPRQLRQEQRPLRQVRFLPASHTILVAGGDPEGGRTGGAVRLLDANDGSVLGELATGLAACSWLSLSRDGSRLTVVGQDREAKQFVQVWRVPERRRELEIAVPGAAVAHLFGGGSRLLVLCNRSDLQTPGLIEFDLSDGVRRRPFPTQLDRGHRFVLFNAAETLAIMGHAPHTCSIHPVQGNYTDRAPIEGHAGYVLNAALSPDEKLLATASEDETVRLWDFDQRMELLVLRGDLSAMTDVRFSPDGQLLAATQASGAVRLWNARPVPRGRRAQ